MSALQEAKRLLPLPQLLERLGYAECAKKSAKCPFHDDSANSFSVYHWHCFAGCGGGDEPDFIGKLEGLDNAAACSRYIERADVPREYSGLTLSPNSATGGNHSKPSTIPPIPAKVAESWAEGVDYFFDLKRAKLVRQLGEFRGWPLGFTMFLIESGLISYPLYEDPRTRKAERCLAFQVVVPEWLKNRMAKKLVGYHVRVREGKDVSWRFVPAGIPSVPFILGDFETAKLLIITEGQFDALTFALAAGWLGEGCNWPQGVGVLGLRGVDSVNTFLSYYRQFWPVGASCLVLPDNDGPGRRWHTGADCFVQKLQKLCAHVAAARCSAAKDFNDLYKAQPIGPPEIAELLAQHGMSAGSEVVA
jgi:hypothetical protein